MTDNGPAYKSADFMRFIAGRSELTHVRTRHHAPETNGVVERFNGSLKYEHLYRLEIADALELADQTDTYRTCTTRSVLTRRSTSRLRSVGTAEPTDHTYSEPESVQEFLDAGHIRRAAVPRSCCDSPSAV